WHSPTVQPQQNWPARKLLSLRGVQSSVLEAPVSGSIPAEEVVSDMFAGKSPNPSRSRFSLSSQSVKGGFSSSYEPVSHTQSAPSVLDSVSSLLRLQGSSSPSAQNVVSQSASRQGSYSWSAPSSPDAFGLQGVSAQLASTSARGGSSSGLSDLSQGSPSLSTPGSLSKLSFSPFDVSGLPTTDQSSSNMFAASSQSSSGLQLGGTSNLLSTQSSSSTGSSGSSGSLFTSHRGSAGPQLAGGSSRLISTSGLLTQSPSTENQRPSGSSYAKLAASPLGFSQSTSGQSSYSQYASSSQSRVGTQVAAGLGSGYGLSVQPQGTTSQYAPSRFSSLSSAGGSFSATDGSSVQSQGTFSQNVPSPFGPKVPAYSQAAPSGSFLSLSQPSPWQSSVSRSQSFQTSGAVASQSSSPSQGFKAPSRFSTSAVSPSQLVSTQEGSGRYSGLSVQSQSTSSQYSTGPSAYAKLAASPLGVSQSTSGQGSYSQYTSSSQSRADTQLAGTSRFAPMQTGSTFTGGSSLQLQGTSSQYAPSLDVKVPVYSQAPSGPSLSLSQPSQWQPSSRWSQGFQTSGAVAAPSTYPSQSSKAPSRFPAVASAASPGQFTSAQEGSSRYGGLSSLSQSSSQYSTGSLEYAKQGSSITASRQSMSSSGLHAPSSQSMAGTQLAGSRPFVQTESTFTDGSSLQLQGTSSQYAPASLDAKVPVYSQAASSGSSALSQTSRWEPSTSRWSQGFQTSGTVASQSSSPSQGSKAPSRFSTIASVASPSQFASAQEGSAGSSGLSIQSTSSQYSPGSSAYAKLAASPLGVSQLTSGLSSYSQYTSSSQSRAGTQLAGSSQYVPMQMGGPSTDLSSLQLQGISSQYAPSPSSAKVYSQAAPSGPSLSPSQPSLWQTSSRWSQGFQTSGTVASQSSPLSQGSKVTSRFPTLSVAPSPAQFASAQEGSGRYSGLSSLSQGTSSQYGSGFPAYAKRGSSLLDVSSQSTSDQSSSGLYASSSQSMAGTQLAGSSRPVPVQTGSTLAGGSSFQFQGTSNKYAPSASSQYTQASPSGSSLTGSSGKWQTTWSQGFQASGAAVPPQSSQTSSGTSFLQSLSPSVDSLAQSSSSSSRRASSFFGVGLRPSKLSAQAASGSTTSSQLSPALSASFQHPSDSMTSSLGSSVQGTSQGAFS
ncbi:hypothetical protein M9458_024484, partial [Cirrhinus mrigala]